MITVLFALIDLSCIKIRFIIYYYIILLYIYHKIQHEIYVMEILGYVSE